MSRFGLSARAYHRILKVARTIADLASADTVGSAHVAEAIGYRRFDSAEFARDASPAMPARHGPP
jgi:magnesium chelatase family protein